MKPLLLDLYCGAGGCARGYQEAGFYVVGVDNRPQPQYAGDEFIQGDALEYAAMHAREFDVVHASPPCQQYSALRRITRKEYPDLIDPTRRILQAIGLPYIIENVPGAPLHNPLMLCGTMFGLNVIRHRLFEIQPAITIPTPPCNHVKRCARSGSRPVRGKEYISVAGHFSDVAYAREAMGIHWMTRNELAQAIPPAYTRHIGRYLIAHIKRAILQ